MEAHGTGELIDVILKEAPALAVRGLAVVAEGTAVLRDGDAQVQKPLVILRGQQLPTGHNPQPCLLGVQNSWWQGRGAGERGTRIFQEAPDPLSPPQPCSVLKNSQELD